MPRCIYAPLVDLSVRRRAGLLLLGVVSAFAFTQLVPSAVGSRAREGGTFRFVGPDVLAVADPAINGAFPSGVCGALMGYPDKALPEGLRLAPELAVASPGVSDGGKTYTFVIRRNAHFSTGKPVLARDAKDSLERVLTPALKSEVAYLFENVAGARRMLSGKATALSGVTASGRTLVVRLVTPVPDFPARTSQLCVTPAGLPRDAEGVKAPIPSAAPYYVSRFIPGEQIVDERNTFYAGERPQHVDRFVGDFSSWDPAAAVEQVAKGEVESMAPVGASALDLGQLARRYGVNRSQFFVRSGLAGRSFYLNTSRPLFRDNAELRRAVNFAVDRAALIREFGRYAATSTDQFLPPAVPGYRNARIYPLDGPDLQRARALAAGHTRGGRAVLYTCTEPSYCIAPAQVLQRDLRAIGLRVQIKSFPIGVYFQKAAAPHEPYDIILIGWGPSYNDPGEFLQLFDGRSGAANFSHFDDPKYNRLLDRAGSLSGEARYRAYGDLDVQLARDAAPAIPYAVYNTWAFVSPNVGCVIMKPDFDMDAACLK